MDHLESILRKLPKRFIVLLSFFLSLYAMFSNTNAISGKQ